jgi:hypothetical protein
MGVKHDRTALPFYSHRGKTGLSLFGLLFLDEMNHRIREEKLLESSGIREEG